MKNKKGKRRTVWLSNKLDKKAEEIRQKLSLGHPGFYRYAVVEVIKQFATTPTGEAPKQ
jgi:hypothetical protein